MAAVASPRSIRPENRPLPMLAAARTVGNLYPNGLTVWPSRAIALLMPGGAGKPSI